MSKSESLIFSDYNNKHKIIFLKIAVLFLAALSISIAFRSGDKVANVLLTDDGYYALTVAKNIASSKGITIDGKTQTNGFQPLFTLLSTPAFLIAKNDRYLALRIILFLHWLFFLLTALMLGLIVKDTLADNNVRLKPLAFWVTLFLYLSSVPILLAHFNGLETGFYLFFIALIWRIYQIIDIKKIQNIILLSFLLGLCVLARIDSVFFVIILSVALLIRRDLKISYRIRAAFLTGMIAFVVSLPWWLYNWFYFHSLMPSGAKAQQAWMISGKRLKDAIIAICQDLLPHFYTSHYARNIVNTLRIGVCVVIGITLIWILWKKSLLSYVKKNIRKRSAVSQFAVYILLFILLLIMWYTTSSWASHSYNRYFSILFLLSIPVLSGLFLWANLRLKSIGYIVFVAFLIPITIAIVMLHTGKGYFGNILYTEQLALVRENVSPDDIVSAGQSGTLGYFRNNVVNLDGKVNVEALGFQDHMWDYLRSRQIYWLCDTEMYTNKYLGNNPNDQLWIKVAQKGICSLYRYRGDSQK